MVVAVHTSAKINGYFSDTLMHAAEIPSKLHGVTRSRFAFSTADHEFNLDLILFFSPVGSLYSITPPPQVRLVLEGIITQGAVAACGKIFCFPHESIPPFLLGHH